MTKKTKPSALALTRKLRALERQCAALQSRLDAEPSYDSIMTAARRWHFTEVRSLASDALSRLTAQRETSPMTDREARDWLVVDIDQSTNGHESVIYIGQAGLLLAASDNDGAYESEYGGAISHVSARACCALRADVWEEIESRKAEWAHEEEEGES